MNPRPPCSESRSQRGYLLAELTVALAVGTLLAGVLAGVVALSLDAYTDVRARHAVVERVDQALRRMQRDLRRAVPRSVRNGGPLMIEFMHIADAARYRAGDGSGPAGATHTGEALQPGAATAAFNVTGRFENTATLGGLAPGHRAILFPAATDTLYQALAANADSGPATPATTTLTRRDDGDEDQLALSAAHAFTSASPAQRLFLSDTPVLYRCDLAAGTLIRHWNYTVTATPGVPNDGDAAIMVDGVTDCDFVVAPRPVQDYMDTVRLSLTVAGDNAHEPLRLLHQVHVVNQP